MGRCRSEGHRIELDLRAGIIMPYVSRLFLKTGIAYLVLTFALGAALLVLEAFGHPAPFIADVEHGHAGFVGWLVNMVVGIAYWLLPLNRTKFPQTQGRYPEHLARSSFYLLNAGLILRLVAEPWFAAQPSAPGSVLLVIAAFSQLTGIAIFAWIGWHRVFAPLLRPEL
jgi:hypothetical protein